MFTKGVLYGELEEVASPLLEEGRGKGEEESFGNVEVGWLLAILYSLYTVSIGRRGPFENAMSRKGFPDILLGTTVPFV